MFQAVYKLTPCGSPNVDVLQMGRELHIRVGRKEQKQKLVLSRITTTVSSHGTITIQTERKKEKKQEASIVASILTPINQQIRSALGQLWLHLPGVAPSQHPS
ncbi:uncharacterized protein TrAtP1_003579 [Trichoderma atroviride]|uniref:uncharacterized protein n=1 Tax=Hypocrea atroviridis TaxID=63577 RepID=UPI0033219EE4|nr:hypothetical protein TrAtP1_003579 [Trichoderma atroviride]